MRLFLIILMVGIIAGCDTQESLEKGGSKWLFPPGATKITHLSDEWATFEFQGNKFLIHRHSIGSNATATMAVIPSSLSSPKHGRCPNCNVHLVATDLGFVKVNE